MVPVTTPAREHKPITLSPPLRLKGHCLIMMNNQQQVMKLTQEAMIRAMLEEMEAMEMVDRMLRKKFPKKNLLTLVAYRQLVLSNPRLARKLLNL